MAIYEMRVNRLRAGIRGAGCQGVDHVGRDHRGAAAGFSVGHAIEGTSLDYLTPYIDPAVLALVCLVIIPMPIGTIQRALADVRC